MNTIAVYTKKKTRKIVLQHMHWLCAKNIIVPVPTYEFHNCTFLYTLLSASSMVIIFGLLHTKSNHDIAFFFCFSAYQMEAFHTNRALQKSSLVYTLWTHQRHRDITQWVSILCEAVMYTMHYLLLLMILWYQSWDVNYCGWQPFNNHTREGFYLAGYIAQLIEGSDRTLTLISMAFVRDVW